MRKVMITLAALATLLVAAEIEIGTTGPPKGFPFGC